MAAVAGDEVRGARGLEGEEANLLVGLGASRGGRKRLVGIGTEHSGEGTHRQRGFSRGMARERGRWATLEQGEAAGMVGRGGAALERWVHDGQELAGDGNEVVAMCAGDEAWPGLYIGQKGEDEQERRSGIEFGRRKGQNGDGGVFPWAAGEMSHRGALGAVWRSTLAPVEAAC